jgi:hypothetical protein
VVAIKVEGNTNFTSLLSLRTTGSPPAVVKYSNVTVRWGVCEGSRDDRARKVPCLIGQVGKVSKYGTSTRLEDGSPCIVGSVRVMWRGVDRVEISRRRVFEGGRVRFNMFGLGLVGTVYVFGLFSHSI